MFLKTFICFNISPVIILIYFQNIFFLHEVSLLGLVGFVQCAYNIREVKTCRKAKSLKLAAMAVVKAWVDLT